MPSTGYLTESAAPRQGAAPCVLVVDDDLAIRQALTLRLQHHGYRVQSASSGEQAVAIVDQGNTDLVLLDVKMPGIDGFEVCDMVRKSHRVPVIFLTGASDATVLKYLPEMTAYAGGECFLRKPLDTRVVLSVVGEVLRR